MYYFDNLYLKQYIDSGAELDVYYNSEWYSIADLSDLNSEKNAIGYDEYGEAKQIPYKQIELIQVNGSLITLEQLQSMMTGKEVETEEQPSKKSEDDIDIEEPAPEEKSKEKEPDLSWFSPHYEIGKDLLKEIQRRNANRNKRTN